MPETGRCSSLVAAVSSTQSDPVHRQVFVIASLGMRKPPNAIGSPVAGSMPRLAPSRDGGECSGCSWRQPDFDNNHVSSVSASAPTRKTPPRRGSSTAVGPASLGPLPSTCVQVPPRNCQVSYRATYASDAVASQPPYATTLLVAGSEASAGPKTGCPPNAGSSLQHDPDHIHVASELGVLSRRSNTRIPDPDGSVAAVD